MLEGLEISIVDFSFVNNSQDSRLDPSYYSKLYLNVMELVKSGEMLGTISETYELHSNGSFADIFNILHKDSEREVRYIRSENVGNYFIEGETDFISAYAHKNLPKTITKLGDILTARTGKVGGASVITNNWVDCNSNQNIVNIRINDWNTINPYYLTVFLNSLYGRTQFEKSSTGNVQPWLNLSLLRRVKVPILDKLLQEKISSIFNSAYAIKQDSETNYKNAELILYEQLGLKDFKPSQEPVNIKKLSESFGISGRLDAEYYQKKYEEVVNHITVQKFDRLLRIVNIKKSIEPGSDAYSDEGGLPFYRVSDYNKYGLSKPDKELKEIFVSENSELIEKLKPKQGTILFSKDGSVGTAYLLRKDLDGITSGAILHLTVRDKKQIIPEYLTLALNSKLVQMQAERDAGGSIILHWRVGEIENVVVPIIDYTKQEEIAELVEESFKLKKQSENILEVAKRAVEIAIEENEVVALKYIENANIN